MNHQYRKIACFGTKESDNSVRRSGGGWRSYVSWRHWFCQGPSTTRIDRNDHHHLYLSTLVPHSRQIHSNRSMGSTARTNIDSLENEDDDDDDDDVEDRKKTTQHISSSFQKWSVYYLIQNFYNQYQYHHHRPSLHSDNHNTAIKCLYYRQTV